MGITECNKVCFSKKEAESILTHSEKTSHQYRKEHRCYYCKECNAWHLTSKEEDTWVTPVKVKFFKRWRKLLNKK